MYTVGIIGAIIFVIILIAFAKQFLKGWRGK
jgi:hypothetical protein